MKKSAKRIYPKAYSNLILLFVRPGKSHSIFRFSFLTLGIALLLWKPSSGQNNEDLAKDLVKNNWIQLESSVKISKVDSLVLVQAGESSPRARYFFSSLNSVLLKDGFKNIFLNDKEVKNGFKIETYLKKFSIRYFPIKRGLFKQKKFRRIEELIQNIQVVNIADGKILWSGDLTSVKRDTLTQTKVLQFRKNQISFMRGAIEQTEGKWGRYLKLSFLAAISVAVIVLFFSVRTT